jgi:phosphoglycerate dehydrogenase-like enzyme
LLLCCCRFGAIGRRVAELAAAYQMRVVALQRDTSKAQPDIDSGLLVRGC